ncbi:MAG: hypothetical protein AVDCRST_MAG59-5285, partial [uncultured Thermomicrobiales bacterium]
GHRRGLARRRQRQRRRAGGGALPPRGRGGRAAGGGDWAGGRPRVGRPRRHPPRTAPLVPAGRPGGRQAAGPMVRCGDGRDGGAVDCGDGLPPPRRPDPADRSPRYPPGGAGRSRARRVNRDRAQAGSPRHHGHDRSERRL